MADEDTKLLLHLDPYFNPPQDCGDGRCRPFFMEFIYIVVIPASFVVLVLLIIICSLFVCCCMNRRKKSSADSDEQLASYDAVRRASISVRRMSHSNNTPLLDSRSGSMSLVRNDHRRRGFRPRDSCHSAPGTLQRHHRNKDSSSLQELSLRIPAPPPYGAPPQYPVPDEEDAFLGPEVPLQDVQAEEADRPAEEPQHARHHRHHRRQRPYSAANGYMTR